MHKKDSLLKRFLNHFSDMGFARDDYEYAITFGMLSSVFLFIKGLMAIAFTDGSFFLREFSYLSYLAGAGLLTVLMILVHIGKIPHKSKLSLFILKTYPYLFITIAILATYTYTNTVYQTMSFVAIVIILSWIKIFGRVERIIVFLYATVLFNFMGYLMLGRSFFDTSYLEMSIMASLLGYFTALIYYLIRINQVKTADEMDETNKDIRHALLELEKTNTELRMSHKVTASMLTLTQEVLRNEEIEDVLQLVLDETMNLVPHGQAGSILILKENNKMEYVAARGYKLENLKRIHLHYEDLFQAHFEEPYEPNIIKNLQVFDKVHIGEEKTNRIFTEATKVAKSCLTCSFMYDGEFYGSINIDNFDSENIYTEHDKYLLKQLAQELEIIITIHHLYEKALKPTKYDGLTQAYTRTYSMKLLESLVDANHKKCIGICTIDINQLKTINDRFGHDIGDQYLGYFAESVREAKLKDNIFGRVGGDEFLLVFADLDNNQCKAEVEKLRKYLKENQFTSDGFFTEITFSYGVALYPTESTNLLELIKISDRKMYEDKRVQNI